MTIPALNLELRVSRWLNTTIILVHGLALVATWFSALPWWAAICLSGAIFLSGAWQWRRHTRLRWRRLCADQDVWRLVGSRDEYIVQPVGEAFISRWLVVLHLARETGSRETLVLLPDSTDKDQLRRLRARLRLGLVPNPNPKP